MSYPPGYTSPPPPGAGGPAYMPPPAPLAGHRLAGWWSRVGAQIIDGLVIGIPATIVFVTLGIGVGNDANNGANVGALIGALLLSLLVFLAFALLYAPLMMSRTNGQTLGRMATGIRVIRADGQPMTFGFAVIREVLVKGLLVGAVSSATFGVGFLLDVLWPLWDDENRALHDFVVNTRSVRAF